jgi:hypothetical protein
MRDRARKVFGWPKRCDLAHASLWEYSYKRLTLAQRRLSHYGAPDRPWQLEEHGVVQEPRAAQPEQRLGEGGSATSEVRPHGRFKNGGTESLSEYGVKRI